MFFLIWREIPPNQKLSALSGLFLILNGMKGLFLKRCILIKSPSPDWIKREFLCDLSVTAVNGSDFLKRLKCYLFWNSDIKIVRNRGGLQLTIPDEVPDGLLKASKIFSGVAGISVTNTPTAS